jgi:hypothetical protein
MPQNVKKVKITAPYCSVASFWQLWLLLYIKCTKKYCHRQAVLRIRIRWIRMFLGLLDPDPDPDPLERSMDPDSTLDPSIFKQK